MQIPIKNGLEIGGSISLSLRQHKTFDSQDIIFKCALWTHKNKCRSRKSITSLTIPINLPEYLVYSDLYISIFKEKDLDFFPKVIEK